VGFPVNGLLGDELQQISKASALLKMWTGNDSLYEIPTLVAKEIVGDS
jgi:hypothetical protein